jgi:hypothetical protein
MKGTIMRYRYTGPNSAVTLKVSDGKDGLKDQDVVLWNGREIDLPANHEWVATLLAKGYLKTEDGGQKTAGKSVSSNPPGTDGTQSVQTAKSDKSRK